MVRGSVCAAAVGRHVFVVAILFILTVKCHRKNAGGDIKKGPFSLPWRVLRAHLLQMKRDDLYIPARNLIHDHMLSLRCHDCVYVTFTSKRGAGSGGWPGPSLDATANESAPVSRITRGGIRKAAVLNLSVVKFAQDLIMKRADPPR